MQFTNSKNKYLYQNLKWIWSCNAQKKMQFSISSRNIHIKIRTDTLKMQCNAEKKMQFTLSPKMHMYQFFWRFASFLMFGVSVNCIFSEFLVHIYFWGECEVYLCTSKDTIYTHPKNIHLPNFLESQLYSQVCIVKLEQFEFWGFWPS